MKFELVNDLPGNAVAWSVGDGTILIDMSAAGHGWFVDQTPFNNNEYRNIDGGLVAKSNSDAYGRMDLLTAISHEFGHLLGYEHGSSELMGATLGAGIRELEGTESKPTSYLPIGISDHANANGVTGFTEKRSIDRDGEFPGVGLGWSQGWQSRQNGAGFPEFIFAGFDDGEQQPFGPKKKRLDEPGEEVVLAPLGQIEWHIEV